MDRRMYERDIVRLWPKAGQQPSKELVELCQRAVEDYPEESVFWYDLGIIIQRCSSEYGYTAKDYLRCLENSVRLDPDYAEAYQELGYILDVYFDDYDRSEQAFRKAINLGAGHESYLGLARVLAQMEKVDDAILSISKNICPFHDHPDIRHLRDEIMAGSWNWG